MVDDSWAKQKKKYRYRGKRITVWWDGAKCNHNGNCLRSLPTVFNIKRPRWVAPDAARRVTAGRAGGSDETGARGEWETAPGSAADGKATSAAKINTNKRTIHRLMA